MTLMRALVSWLVLTVAWEFLFGLRLPLRLGVIFRAPDQSGPTSSAYRSW